MKKAIGMFAALALALAITGVAYAHWTKTLYINGTVTTGNLDAEFSIGPSWDTEPPEKDTSYIYCELDPFDSQILNVYVVDAYPSIDYYQLFDIHNSGSIPLHINSINYISVPPEITVEVYLRGWTPIIPVGTPPMVLPVQLHPSDVVWGIVHVHVEQEAEQETPYEFSVEIIADQWNYTPPG